MKVFIEQKVKASFSVLKNTMYCLKNEKEETKDAIKILFNKFKDKDKLSEEDVEFVLNQAKTLFFCLQSERRSRMMNLYRAYCYTKSYRYERP
jgi:hypothetical protein